ncbi:hypothetical protein FACS1894192_04830 [Bacilli bacterium]|nr:hypothetical protein FACS1894192_04830 [Bacilli bacterium]
MESKTTILKMIEGNKIIVPDYQRAYAWEVGETSNPKQVDQFITDIEEYISSHATTPYYFGHFLFERKGENSFAVIDGQQRLTTIIICLATMFKQDDEKFSDIKKKMIGEKFDYHFETVRYDNNVFESYVFEDVLDFVPDTISQKRIKESYDRFKTYFNSKSLEELDKILDAIKNARCSTYIVDSETEAVQMFIFENNRGKSPSDLEILKANMMFGVHLQDIPEHKKSVVNQYLSKKFESIYHSISQIEMAINEDNVLTYALQVYENNLKVDRKRMLNKVDKLIRENAVKFATEFTEYLEQSFSNLFRFFGQDRKEIWEFEELISLKDIGLAIPFILKAYKYNISSEDKARLAKSMRDILLRKRLIRRQADLNIRLGDVFEGFSEKYNEVQPIVERIEWLKNVDNGQWRSAYWNNEKLTESLERVNHQTAKYLLWLYEKHLAETKTTGYNFKHGYDELMINGADLEHIAPQTSGAEGYPEDDQDFRENYLNSLGNYLLLSDSHNRSISNISFEEKRQTYQISPLYQQREVVEMTDLDRKWTKELIVQRKQTIIDFIMEEI